MRSVISFLLLLLSLLSTGAIRAHAYVIILTNRPGAVLPLALLADSRGTPLPANSLGKAAALALPAGTTPSSVAAACGLPILWYHTRPFGTDLRIGPPPSAPVGIVEQEIRQPMPLVPPTPWHDRPVFLYFFNAPTMDQATEVLLLEFPDTRFLADFAPSLERQSRLHLSQATVHIGSRQPDGSLRTAPLAQPSFESWAAAALSGTNAFPQDDPDRDGVSNLLEYLSGTSPSVPDAEHSQPELRRHPDQTLTFSWRQALCAAHATFTPLSSATLGEFRPIPTPSISALPPVPLPPGVEWRSITLPVLAPNVQIFLTLRGTLLPVTAVKR